MKEKKNDLWRLDLLEAKFTQNSPRFPLTKKLLNARNNPHVLKKLPDTPNEAFKQIHALKADLFAKKYHGSYTRLQREVVRRVKQDSRSWTGQHDKLDLLFKSPDFLQQLVSSKLAKIIMASVLSTREDRQNPPSYLPAHLRSCISDKTDPSNPSQFFIAHCQSDKVVNGYISKLWNCTEIKKVLQESEWSFRKIRGNLTKEELAAHQKETGRKVDHREEERGSGSHSRSDSDSDSSSDPDSDAEPEQMDAEEAFDKFASYDNLVAGSDEETEFVADPNVDYAAITDQELSSEDSESADVVDSRQDESKTTSKHEKEKKIRKEKIVLPQLATGYFSGGSDDEDFANDRVVKEATTTRKNRRGQRARQKIWEQKYGASAAHVQKEKSRIASEREQHQREFEERQRKRELKAKAAQESGKYKDAESKPTTAHPSWEAKKRAEEKMKTAKFQGKKITFD